MQSDIFDVQKAIQTLKNNAGEIERLGKRINELRINHAITLGRLRDKEQQARKKYFNKDTNIKVSELSVFLKHETFEEAYQEEKEANEIKRLIGLMDVLIEVNNALKFAAKLAHIEISF